MYHKQLLKYDEEHHRGLWLVTEKEDDRVKGGEDDSGNPTALSLWDRLTVEQVKYREYQCEKMPVMLENDVDEGGLELLAKEPELLADCIRTLITSKGEATNCPRQPQPAPATKRCHSRGSRASPLIALRRCG